MQAGLIIRAFIASPSDVEDVRREAATVIGEWNAAHSVKRQAIIEPVMVRTHSQLEQGDHPQEIINRQLLDRCDFLIAIFWSRLGTRTNKERSGTIHEIKDFTKRKGGNRVLLFFSEKHVPGSIDASELKELQTFKQEMQSAGLYRAFKDTSGFARELRNQLDIVMHALLDSDQASKLRSDQAQLDERSRIASEAHRIQMSQILGQEIPPPPTKAATADAKQAEADTLPARMTTLADLFERRWKELETKYKSRPDAAPARNFLKDIAASLCDLARNNLDDSSRLGQRFDELRASVDAHSERKVDMGSHYQIADFWIKGYELAQQVKDVAQLITVI